MGSTAIYEYKALRQPDEIRLFQLSSSSDPETDIHGSIIHTTISEESALSDSNTSHPPESPAYICCDTYHPSDAYSLEGGYTALSYAWGNPEKSCAVFVDGKRLPITANLDQALRSLRLEAKSPRLWVDSICINQASDQERNHQVRQMCLIYKTATSTIIFLGPATTLSTSCFKATATGLVKGPEIARKYRWDPTDLGLHFLELAKSRDEILRRSWFTRAWTFQELVVSRRPWICCGTTCIPWSQLCSYFLQDRRWDIALGTDRWSHRMMYANSYMPDPWGLGNAVRGRYSIVKDPDTQCLQITIKGFMIMDKVRQIYHAGPEAPIKEADKFSLYSLLEHRQGFAASDFRDAVFSLYGILDQSDTVIQWTPVDYEKCTARSFTDLAATLLSSDDTHGYAPFIHIENGRDEIEDLPSWVPNWAAMRKYRQSIRNNIFDRMSRFRSKESDQTVDLRVYKDHNAVACRGHHSLSRIVKLSPPVPLEEKWLNDWNIQVRIFVDGSHSLLVTSGEDSGHGLPEISVKVNTTPTNNVYDPLSRRELPDFSPKFTSKNDVPDLTYRRAECIPGRRFALLDDNELALVPEQARVDDQICHLKGAQVLFTVRKAVDKAQSAVLDRRVLDDFEGRILAVGHYHLIGECCKGDYESVTRPVGSFDMGFILH
jgi:hypothetical protein